VELSVVADALHEYRVEETDAPGSKIVTGKTLHAGDLVRLEPGMPLRLVVGPR
jgi:hypothetical protein